MNTRQIDFRFQPDVQQTCIGFADDPHKTLVREDGSLNYNFAGRNDFSENRVNYTENISRYHVPTDSNEFFRHRLKPRFTHNDVFVSRTQDFGDARIAWVGTTEEYQYTTLNWDCFGYKDENNGVRADVIRWKLKAKKGFGYASSRVELELHGNQDDAPVVLESSGTTDFYSLEGLRLIGVHQYAFLNEGDERRGVFVVVLEGTMDPDYVTTAWGDFAWEECRQYWLNLRPFRNRFQIPEPQIQDMLEACARNILQAREVHGGNTVYQVGPTIYRGLWTVDGHFLLQAAHIMGRRREAFEQGLMAILRRVQPNGSVELIPKHYKETGIAIATIVRQCELMDDNERLINLWPTILRGIDYIKGLRAEAQDMGADYPAQSLFPPAVIDGGIEGPFPDYTTPAWILVGLKKAKDIGERLVLPRSNEIAELYGEIYKSFIACANRDIRHTKDGIPYIPMSMEHQKYNRPQSATWALAQAIYPGELFSPNHEYVTNLLCLLDSVDDEEGLPKETGWIHHQGIWSYSGMFYAQVWLYAGYPEKAIDYLYAFANHAAPSRVWREEHTLSSSPSSEYCGDMPHNWGSAELIRLVRNALVMEVGGGLDLLAALPPEWMPSHNQDLILEKTPTRYGLVSLRICLLENNENESAHIYSLGYELIPSSLKPQTITVIWNGKRYANVIGVNTEKLRLTLTPDTVTGGGNEL